MNHAIRKQAEISANILSMYTNVDKKNTLISVENFQKSYSDDTHVILTDNEVKDWCKDQIEKGNKIEDASERETLIKSAVDELNSYQRVNVIAESGINKAFFVKEKKAAVVEEIQA